MAQASFGVITAIDIDQIDTSDRLRPVDPANVEGLAASIAQIGLMQPIILRPEGNQFRLVAGAHRLAAVASLGWGSVDAIVENLTADEARLVEIDENLMRRELSALDRAINLAERKVAHDAVYPETSKPGRRKKELGTNCPQFGMTFTKQVAARLGIDRKTVDRALALVKNLAPEARDALRLSDLADNQSELIKLAALDPDQQVAIAREIAEGRAAKPKQARLALGFDVVLEQDAQEKLFVSFLALWARAEAPLRKRISDHVGTVFGAKVSGTKAKKAKGSAEGEAP